MLCSLSLIFVSCLNNLLFVQGNVPVDHSLGIHKFIVNNNMFEIAVPFLILLSFLLIYKFLKIKSGLNNKYAENYSKLDSKNKETQFYFLFLGIVLPLLETIFVFFEVRSKSLLVQNFVLGALLLSIYLISKKSSWVFQNIQTIFKTLFFNRFPYHIQKNNLYFSGYDSPNSLSYLVFLFL